MPSRRSHNMSELAARAKCSVSTVSRALRGSPLLPSETIERIRALADEMGYRPNSLLGEVMRQMRTHRSGAIRGNIAYLTVAPRGMDLNQHGTYAAFYAGARERAAELGFALDNIVIRDADQRGPRLTRMLKARGHRGLIIGPARGRPLGPSDLGWSDFSAVKIGIALPEVELPRVGHYHHISTAHALGICRARGYTRPGLALQSQQTGGADRGWLTALAMYQHDHGPNCTVPALVTDDWNVATFSRWFRKHRPDVVLSLRAEVVEWLRKAGSQVPQEVGFVHLDRCTETTDAAGIDQFPKDIGRSAVDMLFSILLNPNDSAGAGRHLLLQGGWVEGSTVRGAR
jgi:DNA-binding LacI/PurR family transcriptional regulator